MNSKKSGSRGFNSDYWSYVMKNRRRKAWNTFVRFTACFVVFCTTYALILPAITLEYQAECGYEEHQHLESCYELQTSLACGLEETEGHNHTLETCYEYQQVISCGLEEIQEHIHAGDCCDSEGALVCSKEEIIAHTHGANCYDAEGSLTCEMEEVILHTHSDQCFSGQSVQVCQMEETAGHTHDEGCSNTESVLICGLEAHTHDDLCFPAGSTSINSVAKLALEDYTASNTAETSEATEATETTAATEATEATEATVATEATEPDSTESTEAPIALLSDDSTTATAADLSGITPINGYYPLNGIADMKFYGGYDVATMAEETPTDDDKAVYDPETDTFDVALRIDFTLTKEEIQAASNKFTYELPENVSVPEELLGSIYPGRTTAGDDAFYYKFESYIDENGKTRYRVNVEFKAAFLDTVADGAEVKSFIEFHGDVSGDSVNEEGDIVIDFDGNQVVIPSEEIEYPGDQTHDYSIKTEKTIGEYSLSTNDFWYSVTISSEKGTPGPVIFDDQVDFGDFPVEAIKEFTIIRISSTGEETDITSTITPTTVTDKEGVNGPAGKASVTMELPQLAAGEKYEIRYQVDTGNYSSGTSLELNNTATAQSTIPGSNTIISSDSTTNNITGDAIDKSGSYDMENQEIDWTIIVNPEEADIYHYRLTDPAFEGKTAEELEEMLDIQPSDGYEIHTDPSSGDPYIYFVRMDDDWWGGWYPVNRTKYTITYSTKQAQTTAATNVSNTVTLTPPNGQPSSDTATVTVPSGGSITKKFVSADPDNKLLTWQINIDLPAGGVSPENALVTDIPSNQNLSKAQMQSIYNSLVEVLGAGNFTLEGNVNGTWKEYSAISDQEVSSQFRLTFTNPSVITEKNLTNITLTYTTSAEFYNDSDYSNSVNFGDKSDSEQYYYKTRVEKLDNGGYGSADGNDVTTEDGLIKWYARVYVESASSKVEIVDTLPEGISLEAIGISNDNVWLAEYNATGINATDTVTILGTTYNVTNSVATNASGQEEVTTIVTAPDGSTIPAGSVILVCYVCSVDDLPEVGIVTESFTNHVHVDVDGKSYGSDDQTQDVTIATPDALVKTDENGNASDSSITVKDGIVGWYVEIFLTEEVSSFSVDDHIPGGLTPVKVAIGTSRNPYQNVVTVSATENEVTSGTVYLFDQNMTLSNKRGPKHVETTVTAAEGETLPARTKIYLYYEFEITGENMVPAAGNKIENLVFQNKATLHITGKDPVEDTHTQTVTYDIPALVEKFGVDQNGYTQSGTMTFDSTSGIVKWVAKVTVPEDTSSLEITDTLPAGVKPLKIGFGVDNEHHAKTEPTNVESNSSGTLSCYGKEADYVISGTGAESDPYSIKIATKGFQLSAGTPVYVYYECQIMDLPEEGAPAKTFTLTNTVSATADSTKLGEAEHTQEVTVEIPILVQKTDGNLNTETTVVKNEDGVLSWYVKVNLTGNPAKVVVTDTLPAGVKLTKLGINSNNSPDYAKSSAVSVGGSTSGQTNTSNEATGIYDISGSGTADSPYVVTTTINARWGGSLNQKVIYLYYECQIMDLPEPGKTVVYENLRNTASVTVDDVKYGDDVSQEQDVTVSTPAIEYDRIVKGSKSSDIIHRVDYEVLLNQGAEDLSTNNKLTVEDVLTYNYNATSWPLNATLQTDSVKLYYAVKNEDGTFSKGEEVTDWSWVYESNENDVFAAGWGEIQYKIIATVPDDVALIFAYTYSLEFTEEFANNNSNGVNVSLQNSVSLTGVSKDGDSHSSNYTWEVSGTSGGASTSNSYIFTKFDAENYGQTLGGAEFTVYTAKDDQPVPDNGANLVYTTNANGKFTISNDGGIFAADTMYYVVETKAPEGYVLPQNPQKYYFYFGTDSGTLDVTVEGAYDLNDALAYAQVTNVSDSTSVSVTKQWLDKDGNPMDESATPTSIQVDLLQDGNFHSSHTITKDMDWKLSISDLPRFNPATGELYSYTFSEQVPSGYTGSYMYTGNDCIITNQQQDLTNIEVVKQYTDGYEGKSDVQFYLYRKSDQATSTGTVTLKVYGKDGGAEVKDPITFTAAAGQTIQLDIRYANSWKSENLKVTYNGQTFTDQINDSDYSDGVDFQYLIPSTGSGTIEVVLDDTNSNSLLNWTVTPTTTGSGTTSAVLESFGPFSVGTDDWTWSCTEVPGWEAGLPASGIDANGNKVDYVYFVKEVVPGGYAVTYKVGDGEANAYCPDAASGTITMINTPSETTIEYTSITVDKQWLTSSGAVLADPGVDSITVIVLQNGLEYAHYTITAAEGWTKTITDLPKKDPYYDTECTYSVQEVPISGFTSSTVMNDDGSYTITNTHVPGAASADTEVTVKKEWDSSVANPADSVTIQLYQVETPVTNVSVFAGNVSMTDPWQWGVEVNTTNYSGSFDPSQITEGGYFSVYYTGTSGQIRMAFKTEDWGWFQIDTPTSNQATENGYVSTFSYADVIAALDPNTGSVMGADKLAGLKVILAGSAYAADIHITNVTWTPASSDSDGEPTEKLYTEVTNYQVVLNEANGWTYSWDGLPLHNYGTDGKTINGHYSYFVKETTSAYSVTYKVGDGEATTTCPSVTSGTITVINSSTDEPAPETTTLTITKLWQDANGNALTVIPDTSVSVGIYQNGTLYTTWVIPVNTTSSTWTYSGTLPKCDSNGVEFTYTIQEQAVDGYTSTVNGYTITNTEIPVTEVSVKKVWMENASTELTGDPGASVTIVLKRNGEEYTRKTLSYNDGNDWQYTFEKLPAKDDSGADYTYTVEEVSVNGFTGSGPVLTDGVYVFTNTKIATTEIPVQKVWLDSQGNAMDASEIPGSITVNLLRNNAQFQSVTLTNQNVSSSASNIWEYAFEGLAVTDEQGNTYSYTVQEVNLDGFTSSISKDGDTFVITNTEVIPESQTTSVTVKKQWAEGVTPADVEVKLMQVATVREATSTKTYFNGSYTIDNTAWSSDLSFSISPSDLTENGYLSVRIASDGWWPQVILQDSSHWFQMDNPSSSYADSSTVTLVFNHADLMALTEDDGTTVSDNLSGINTLRIGGQNTTITEVFWTSVTQGSTTEAAYGDAVTLTSSSLTHTWSGLPLSGTVDGQSVTYSYYVVETTTGYKVTYSGTDMSGNAVTDSATSPVVTEGEITITNDSTTTSVTVTKQWFRNGSQITSGYPAGSIEFNLLQNGNVYDVDTNDGTTANTISSDSSWTVTLSNLPKYDANGNAYVYTVEEITEVSGYASAVTGDAANGFIITNTAADATSIVVKKQWVNASGTLPEITYEVYAVTDSGDTEDTTDPTEETQAPTEEATTPNTYSVSWEIAGHYSGTHTETLQNISSGSNLKIEIVSYENQPPTINVGGVTQATASDPVFYDYAGWDSSQTYKMYLHSYIITITADIKITGNTGAYDGYTWVESIGIVESALSVSSYTVNTRSTANGVYVTSGTLNTSNNWTEVVSGLSSGTKYVVVETGNENYSVSYIVNGETYTTCPDLSPGDTVTIVNTLESYELPQTGGMGRTPILMTGAALLTGATWLLHEDNKRKKREVKS